MGQWVFVVQGAGAHHNDNAAIDADMLASEFIKKLQDAGQRVTVGTFTAGSSEILPKLTTVEV